MEYAEGLQNQIFELREEEKGKKGNTKKHSDTKKYISLEYWNSVNGMFEIFEHLINYVGENGLEAELLNYPDYNTLNFMNYVQT